MAEVYFATTGPKHWAEQFANHMEAQMFAIEGIAPNGQKFSQSMGGLMEPIQLWRFIYPSSPATDAYVIKTLKRGKTSPKNIGLPIFAMRKALGLKEIPDVGDVNTGPVMPVNTEHMQIIPIGFKTDEYGVIPTTGVSQEKI